MKQPDNLAANGSTVRAFELDALRGLALLMMMLHHFIFDLRYIMGLDLFSFQETWWFENLLRPVFLNVFLVVSGICCTFSRSNTKRGLRMLAAAMAFTAVSIGVSVFSGQDFYIFFNVLHLLALGTLIYAGLTFAERKRGQRDVRVDVLLLLGTAVIIWLASLLPHWAGSGSVWLLPLGILPASYPGMADFLPIIPWLGFFLTGALIGRQAYAGKKSAFPAAPAWLQAGSRPFGFLGRHSLLIYALHQPILLAILYGLRAAGLI